MLRDVLAVKDFQMRAEDFRTRAGKAALEEKKRLEKEQGQLTVDEMRLNRMAQTPAFQEEMQRFTGQEGDASLESLQRILKTLPNEDRDDLIDTIQFAQFQKYVPRAQQVIRERLMHLVQSGAYRAALQEQGVDPTLEPVVESILQATDPEQTPVFSNLQQISQYAGIMDSMSEMVNSVADEQSKRRGAIEERVSTVQMLKEYYLKYMAEYPSHRDMHRDMQMVIRAAEAGMSLDNVARMWDQIWRRDKSGDGGGLDLIGQFTQSLDQRGGPPSESRPNVPQTSGGGSGNNLDALLDSMTPEQLQQLLAE
jgi:hypothetical protein